MSISWKQNSPVQRLLESKIASGEITQGTKPKDAWLGCAEFQKHKLATFRTKLSQQKLKQGLNFSSAVVPYNKKGDEDEESIEGVDHYACTELPPPYNNSPNKKARVEQSFFKPWYIKNGHWNIYVVAKWVHPITATNFLDCFILLPTGISHNSQYAINVEDDGLSLKICLKWPKHFTSISTLTKIAKIHDPEITDMHPFIGGLTEAFKELKGNIHDDVSDDYFLTLPMKVQSHMIFLKAKAPNNSEGKELMSTVHLRLQGMTDSFANSVRDNGKIEEMTI